MTLRHSTGRVPQPPAPSVRVAVVHPHGRDRARGAGQGPAARPGRSLDVFNADRIAAHQFAMTKHGNDLATLFRRF